MPGYLLLYHFQKAYPGIYSMISSFCEYFSSNVPTGFSKYTPNIPCCSIYYQGIPPLIPGLQMYP